MYPFKMNETLKVKDNIIQPSQFKKACHFLIGEDIGEIDWILFRVVKELILSSTYRINITSTETHFEMG